MVYTIYIMVNGGPAFESEHSTQEEVQAALLKLKGEYPRDHFVCHENLFSTGTKPVDADETPVIVPPDD